jgi:two-component system, OmpR family, sensor histidine kinase MtrB
MNRIYSRVRNSLAIKVIFSTVLLSLVVTGITGSVLNTQLSAGVKDVNLSSALVEARSTIFTAEYRFLLAQGEKDSVVQKVVDDVISSATTLTSSENAREVVFLRSPGNTRENNYEIASNLLDPTSIPSSLSERVRKNPNLVYQYTNMNYLSGSRIKGLAIGQKVQIPNAGQYEMYIIFSLVNQEKTLDLISRSLFLGGFILLLLVALITWLVVRQVVSPVREAAMIATEFTAGDFRKRLKVESQDEIATLGLAFNEMAESIEQQIARLENLSRVQQRFVSDVSHELRTPLTTLRMASEVIFSSKDNFDPIVGRSAELLVAQLDRFEKLLEDLLEVSRFDAEVAVLEAVDFDMVLLVQRCADDLGLVAKERKTEIYVNSSEPVIMIKADIRRVERILRNLLANAIDHSEELQIDVRIVASDHDVAVGVRDYGIGLDENALTRVFDRFWRADPSRARTRGGTGLGLSIALEDARLHNGELEAWGRPGRGSHFVVTLPRNTWESIEARLIKLQPEDYRA